MASAATRTHSTLVGYGAGSEDWELEDSKPCF